MATATKSGQNLSFTYNADGLRTTKTVNGVVHTYYYSGSKLVRETYGDYVLDFFYDQNGTPFMLLQNGNIYYYITNAQGDVIRLVDINGNVAASYRYDPYGKATSALGSHANINPLRYRGYVFDHETGLYYLQSRYYDPEIGRFINADNQLNEKDGLLGYNLFAYCQNNPIMYSDATGHSVTLACIIVGAVIGAIVGACIGASVSKKQTGEVNGWAVAGGAVGGAVVGGLAGWGVGAAATAAGATTTAVASGTIAQGSQAICKDWQSAEATLRQTINSVADYGSRVLSTPQGSRVVDAYNTSTKVIAEAKYGYQAYSQFIQTEVARDAYLLQSGMVNEVQWHFYYSEASGTIGGSYNLIRALLDAGIQVFYH